MNTNNVIEVNNLIKTFKSSSGIGRPKVEVQAVSNLNFQVVQGEAFGLVGESGCGKSTTARIIAKLLAPTSGNVTYLGRDITNFSEKKMRSIRGEIQMVFQDPYSSLNPRQTVGSIISMPLLVMKKFSKSDIKEQVNRLLTLVGLSPEYSNRFPHEFSGGQRQRIGIARAIATNPKVLICDEPVSALDVSIQAQILNLLNELRQKLNLTIIFISHDLGIVRNFCDRVAVMYLGKIVELGQADEIFSNPQHPYTKALLSAAPSTDPSVKRNERIRLEGEVPSSSNPPSGCRFRTRCWKTQEICIKEEPVLTHLKNTSVACHFPLI